MRNWNKIVEVRKTANGRGDGVFALETLTPGSYVFRFTGAVVPRRNATCHDAQIGPDQFLALELPGYCINHSCDPNAGMASDVDLVAIRTIHRGEELTYDYAMTDLCDHENDSPLICRCGAVQCRKVFLGYMALTWQDKQRYKGLIAPWLVAYEKKHPQEFRKDSRVRYIHEFGCRSVQYFIDAQEEQQFHEGIDHNIARIFGDCGRR